MLSRIGARRGGGPGPLRGRFGTVSPCKRIAGVGEGKSPERATVATLGAATTLKYYMGIESSCDDTGVAIVAVDDARDARPRILANVVCSQAEIHAPFGGVVPKLAQEAHQTAIDNAVDSALRDAGVRAADLEAVGVTIGPGLSLCLRVGVSKARELRAQHGVPVIDVHHMEAHALVARLAEDVPFPFLCLLVSGGHNLMLVVEGIGRFVQLGTTLDDALGECYDKTARALDLEAVPSGGAALEALAREGDEDAFSFPVPLKKRRTCDFSFAGLKTSVRLAIEREQQKATPEEVRGSHACVQVTRQAITENAIPLTSKLARETFRMFPGEAFPAASRRTSPRRSKRPRQSTWTSGSEGRSSGRGRATPRSSTWCWLAASPPIST